MPGIYGSRLFIIGSPSIQKPTTTGPCIRCNFPAYRQTYSLHEKTWRWEHEACAPEKPTIERRRTRTGNVLSYVPREYPENGERSTQFDSQLAATLTSLRKRD